MVPKTFHQIWLGPDPMPADFVSYQETWKRHHPGWSLRLWTEADLPNDLRRPEVLEKLRVPAERSDIFRLEILWRHGGVYLDTDFECRRSIEPLVGELDFFVADLKPGRVNNAFIGAEPRHPILDRALEEVRPREFYGHDKAGTGPIFFDNLLRDYPEVKRFEPELFYPSTPAQRESAVAIHHAARSWKDAEGFRKATLRAEERLAKAQKQLEDCQKRYEKAQRELAAVKGDGRRSALPSIRRLFGRPTA